MRLPKHIQDAIKLHNQLYDKAAELGADIEAWLEDQGIRELPHHYMRDNEEPVYPVSQKRLEDIYNNHVNRGQRPQKPKQNQGRTNKRKDRRHYAGTKRK